MPKKTFHINFFIFFLVTTFNYGQNCAPTYTPSVILYPNTNTSGGCFQCVQYLCSPNTIYNDGFAYGCAYYLNNGSTLYIKTTTPNQAPPIYTSVWAKSNCTVSILPGSEVVFIAYEPGATIVDPESVASLSSCALITFPTVNCSTGMEDYQQKLNLLITPNPANEYLNLDFTDSKTGNYSLNIINNLGQDIYHKNNCAGNLTIDTWTFSNGLYFIHLKFSEFEIIKKFIVYKE